MDESEYVDVLGDTVVLVDSVRETILLKHPEVRDFINRIQTVLADPDEVRLSIRDKRSVLYYRYESDILNGKWIVVVVKRIDRNFVSTIYATDLIKAGGLIWKKVT